MTRHLTTTIATLALAGAAAVGAVATAAPASADTNTTLYASCQGTRVAAYDIRNSNGSVLSTLEVYEDGRYRESVLCVRNVHRGSWYGTYLNTSVRVGGLYDTGSYRYYAGAIRTYGAWDGHYSITYGGTNPEVDGRTSCFKASGTTSGYERHLWLCESTSISR